MTDFGDNAPAFDLTINGKRVSDGVRAVIESAEYESADGMADVLRVQLVNVPDDQGRFPLSDSRLFAPGNEVSLFGGYGVGLKHIGRGIIRKVRNNFPQGGTPDMEVIAYTKDAVMSDTAPESLKEKKKKGNGMKNSKAGRRFKDFKYSDAVEIRAADYGFELDVDPTPDAAHDFIQRAGMSDFEFITGLANLTGYYFWVDGDEDGIWTLHFKDPEQLKQSDIQDKEYTFKYNDGDFSSLFSFEPELAIQSTITKLLVESKDPLTGQVIEAKIDEEDGGDEGPEPIATGDELSPKGNELGLEWKSASSVKVFIEDFSFDVRANRRFKSAAELAAWAVQWFRRNKENFILSTGISIGVESLRARQVHTIAGVGLALDGKYQFTRVKHIFSPGGGYTCNFSCRKIVGAPPPPAITATIQEIPVAF